MTARRITSDRIAARISADQQRVRATYAERQSRLGGSDKYSLANPGHLFAIQQRQRAVLACLAREGVWPLVGKRVLEVGSGNGEVLQEWLGYGVRPERLHGADILADRLETAHGRLPHVAISGANGGQLPYADDSFDVVLQFTVFSSILDKHVCYTVASEMRRVLRPGGLILWYDFWLNPLNKQTRGIRRQEVRDYFPDCRVRFDRITLAPPLARRLAPVSWPAALCVEALGLFNTHYLAAIRPIR
ncbi:class I SAM-dependent methyltransferase [Promineifilum sp.]|uniref:class I SAM-dependent methyltransferase n=1 Tax=Promineifilum sp. TaxID=2664178 RepID=UPI0035AE9932